MEVFLVQNQGGGSSINTLNSLATCVKSVHYSNPWILGRNKIRLKYVLIFT